MAARSTKNAKVSREKRKNDDGDLRPPSAARRFVLFLAGLALMPLSLSLVRTLLKADDMLGNSEIWGMSASVGMFILGFLLFCGLYIIVRIPAQPYVFGHELTHAMFGLLTGARVSHLRVAGGQGSVKVSRSNILVLLSPYFVPLYMLLLLLAFGIFCIGFNLVGTLIGSAIAGVAGLLWGFHFCFTVNCLMQRQDDLEFYGFFFSVSFILFMNLVVLCLTYVALAPASLRDMTDLAAYILGNSAAACWDGFCGRAWPA